MSLDKKLLIKEGVEHHCGKLFTVRAESRFYELYTKKHGKALDECQKPLANISSLTKYVGREFATYERYMMWRIHMYDNHFHGAGSNRERFP